MSDIGNPHLAGITPPARCATCSRHPRLLPDGRCIDCGVEAAPVYSPPADMPAAPPPLPDEEPPPPSNKRGKKRKQPPSSSRRAAAEKKEGVPPCSAHSDGTYPPV